MISKIYNSLSVNRTQTMMKLLNFNIKFYQSPEELGIEGQRNTLSRFEKYGLSTILKPSYKVLDIGCNTGFFAITVSRYVKLVDGIDNKRANIMQGNIAKKKDYILTTSNFTGQVLKTLKQNKNMM